MAILDRERNAIVLRIVYDGPAGAGKTTSVRALGASLGRPVCSPEEAGERTLFFDWLDYTGGRFEGYQLHCQVVTVPGQALLARRRRSLMRTADAVVYVAGVSASELTSVTDALDRVQDDVDAAAATPIGVVLQANKRDLPEAIPISDLRATLEAKGLRVGIVESTATLGTGIREAFVFGVRLALDRVREQLRMGSLHVGAAEIDSADDLYQWMRAGDAQPRDPMATFQTSQIDRSLDALLGRIVGDTSVGPDEAATDTTSPSGHVVEADGGEPPTPPSDRVLTGMIWPPIDGRLMLADATREPLCLAPVADGWFGATELGWHVHSPMGGRFEDVESGRLALVQWARLHAQHQGLMSPQRCIVLSSEGRGGVRLWQIVRSRPSLRDRLASHLDEADVEVLVGLLLDVATRLLDAQSSVRDGAIPLTLDTLGVVGGDTRYVGLMPLHPTSDVETSASVLGVLSEILLDWTQLGRPIAAALARAQLRAANEDSGRILRDLADLLTRSRPLSQ